jgi:hypothetical protein
MKINHMAPRPYQKKIYGHGKVTKDEEMTGDDKKKKEGKKEEVLLTQRKSNLINEARDYKSLVTRQYNKRDRSVVHDRVTINDDEENCKSCQTLILINYPL